MIADRIAALRRAGVTTLVASPLDPDVAGLVRTAAGSAGRDVMHAERVSRRNR